MNSTTNNQESKYLRASERVTNLKNFYGKAIRGVIAIILVAGINYYLNEWYYPWFLWVVFGVGLSLVLKAIQLFGMNGVLGRDWEERKIKQYMDDDRF